MKKTKFPYKMKNILKKLRLSALKVDVKSDQGFTLIEVLMAVILVAILATIGVTQFADFSTDTKNAATRQSLAVLRTGIQIQYGQMRLRCNATNTAWPTLTQLQANDITSGASPCTTTQISNTMDRLFVAGNIPENPWGAATCTGSAPATATSRNAINSVSVAGSLTATAMAATLTPVGSSCGWQYDTQTGNIKANTGNNGSGTQNESSY